MAILDTELHLLLLKKEYFDAHPESGKLSISDTEPFSVSVEFSGDIEQLKQTGFKAGNIIGNIAGGYTNLNNLKILASHPQVQRIEAQREYQLCLNDSVPEIKADKVWSRSGDNFSGYTGSGVIIGIIDTGIDFNHHVFKKPDGKTRILKIWDQTINAPVNPPLTGETIPGPITNTNFAPTPITLGYGVEYSQAEIDDTITYLADTKNNPKPPVLVRHEDLKGHGTHVAGIAAGNGSQAGDCFGKYHYIGVAPEADIIAVRIWGITKGDKGENLKPPSNPPLTAPSNNTLTDAISYIVNEAKSGTPTPLVINISLGLYTDVIDGTASSCKTIDTILKNNSEGTAIVISAGNFAETQYHVQVNVPAGPTATIKIPFELKSDDKKPQNFSVKYNGSNLQVRLTSPAGSAVNTIPWVANGATGNSSTANGTGAGSLVTVSNIPNIITIGITPPTNGKNIPGTWTIELKDTGTTQTPVDAFCVGVHPSFPAVPNFSDKSQCTSKSTISETAAGIENITVGNYTVPGLIFGGSLSDSSSRGPTIEASPRTKPELCAPGEDITSAGIADDRCSCCCTCCQSYYVSKAGTSMAAPHVTGTIALMLHKNPTATHTHIRELLIAQADPKDSGSSAEQDPGWGAGKLDAKKVVEILAEINPPITAPIVAVQPDHVAALQEQFLATENGPRLNGLFNRYFPEVMDLINKNKRVATHWHRVKGPVWTRLALKAAYTPDMPVQAADENMNLQTAAMRFLTVLKEFASEAFQRDIMPYEPLLSVISEGMTVKEMINLIGNRHVGSPDLTVARSYGRSFEIESQ